MGKCTERLYNGIVKENPTFVQMLGMCPTLAVTSSAINGAGMGLSTTCILVLSNAFISLLRKVIPEKVRIPSYIVIIASFVTVIQFLMQAYLPSLNDSLGIYIPLIVVNCIILGRAESYASKNKVLPSIFDGLGMGLGFTIGLTLIGMFRELIGKGCVFGFQIIGEGNLLQKTSGNRKSNRRCACSIYADHNLCTCTGSILCTCFYHRNDQQEKCEEGSKGTCKWR